MPAVLRSGSSSLIPEDYARGIIKNATQMSAAMSLLDRRRMSRKTQRMSVLTAKPTAAFVTGADTDVGLKPATSMTWADKTMTAEPIAAIVAISDDLAEDADYDMWGEIKPELEEAIAAAIDAAVFFGSGAPSSWPTAIVPHAVAAGNTVNAGTGVDLAADLNSAMGAVEADGYYPNGWFMDLRERATLRGLRDANRQFLFSPRGPANTGLQNAGGDMTGESRRRRQAGLQGMIWDLDAYTSAMGLVGFAASSGNARYVTGDFDQAILGIRSDIRFQVLKEATLYNADGSVMYALAQQDMSALRVVMRVAYQVKNAPTRLNTNDATRSPFAAVRVP